jgi:hypothetical protein
MFLTSPLSLKEIFITLSVAFLQNLFFLPCSAETAKDLAGYIDRKGRIIAKIPLASGRHEFSDNLSLEAEKEYVYFNPDGKKAFALRGAVAVDVSLA